MARSRIFSDWTMEELAEALGCDRGTLRRWFKNGCPSDSFEEFTTWVTGNYGLGKYSQGLLKIGEVIGEPANGGGKDKAEEPAGADIFGEITPGADQALMRLEQMEAHMARAINKASRKGSALEMAALAKEYLPMVEQLRKLDQSIEKERREIGELIPIEEVKRILFCLGLACRWANAAYLEKFATFAAAETDPRQITEESRDYLWEQFEKCVRSAVKGEEGDPKLPVWFLSEFENGVVGGTSK